jgi:xanthine dehydrogenase accessory factor
MRNGTKNEDSLIIVRGAGDLATGVIYALWMAGYPVIALEVAQPTAIRHAVAISEAVYDGSAVVEGMEGILANSTEEALQIISSGKVAVMVDPDGSFIRTLQPTVVVDAILAKRNLGTHHDMAPLTIALGPGFVAGSAEAGSAELGSSELGSAEAGSAEQGSSELGSAEPGNAEAAAESMSARSIADVDVVIETMRGHNLGRLILSGSALPNTGVPGSIAGHAADRVMHTTAAGVFRCVRAIGDSVNKGDVIAFVETEKGERVPVEATLTGILRGILRDGTIVPVHMKAADIDPRPDQRQNCFTISDKSRSIGNSVLMAIEAWRSGRLRR